jgi:5'-3' exonuclease
MGIPSYYKRLVDTVKGLVSRKHPGKVNTLWMDFNCLIYHCLRRPDMPSYSGNKDEWEEIFLNEIIHYTKKVVAEVKPVDGVFIAIDGVVPMAKMRQQRMRRFKSASFSDKESWDTNAITPGTAFMEKLRYKLEALCSKNKGWKVSSADEPGEGEHKIMDQWRKITDTELKVNAVYGLDADLVVLSLLNGKSPTWLFREDVEMGEIKRDDVGEEQFTWFSIDSLRDFITAGSTCKTSFIRDYCFAMSFLGNDFLPSSLSFKMREDGHDRLLDLLMSSDHKQLIDASGEINTANLFVFLNKLALVEDARILAFINKKNRQANMIGTETGFGENNWPLAERAENILLSGNTLKSTWQKIYLEGFFGKGTQVEDICSSYLYGVNWIWNYYRGKPVCYNWQNNWHLAPLWKWLANTKMPEMSGILVKPEDILPAEQLALVLPPRSWHLIRGAREKKLIELAPWLYPKHYTYTSIGKRYFWECEAEIPIPNILQVKAILDS